VHAWTVVLGSTVAFASAGVVRAQTIERDATARPVVLEVLGLDVALGTATVVSLWTGAHGWWRERGVWGARLGVRQATRALDLDGDGTIEFHADDFGPHGELQLDAGYAVWQRQRRPLAVIDRTLRVRPEPAQVPSYMRYIELIDTLSLCVMSGVRASFYRELEAAVPVGLRLAWRLEVPRDFALREGWVQVRALAFPARGKLGVDAELSWRIVSLYAQYLPKLDSVDGPPGCVFEPEVCEPDFALSAFNPVYDHGLALVGLMFRYTFDWN
jgi:hypothetical protein